MNISKTRRSGGRRVLAYLLTAAMVIALLPAITPTARAAGMTYVSSTGNHYTVTEEVIGNRAITVADNNQVLELGAGDSITSVTGRVPNITLIFKGYSSNDRLASNAINGYDNLTIYIVDGTENELLYGTWMQGTDSWLFEGGPLGTGKLTVTGQSQAGGIAGAGPDRTIDIAGGTIIANGASGGAGIGGDNNQPGGNIIIRGNAKVTATGTSGGAGIGAGNYGTSADITIKDHAFVIASGGSSDGSGVGAGYVSTSSLTTGTANITISDNSVVYAQGGSSGAAAIGTGYNNTGNKTANVNVTIGTGADNPTVVAYAGGTKASRYPVAIGIAGNDAALGHADIQIKSGTVIAETRGAGVPDIGIPADMTSATASVTITGGSVYAVHDRIAPAPENSYALALTVLNPPAFVTDVGGNGLGGATVSADVNVGVANPYTYN
ncbi:MAG: hypothetical protein LBT26_03145, partial [Clostridiales Family XIII bacterium]|nr:hypothetical protein [Clostridiales Family XIII bacterium]